MKKLRSLCWATASLCCIVAMGQPDIGTREYWIDGQISERQELAPTIDLSALAAGIHTFSLRVADTEGLWSAPQTKYFVIAPAIGAATEIVAREYWLDGDIASRQPMADRVAEIGLDALSAGLHSFTLRAQDDRGVWSAPLTKYFVIAPAIGAATEIVAREYWLDGDIASRQPMAADADEIDLSPLEPGLHFLTLRAQDDRGVWSAPLTKYFVLAKAEEMPVLAHYLYWFDGDNAHAQSGPLEASEGLIPVSIKHLSEGRHALSWTVGDTRGKWSPVAVDSFQVDHIRLTEAMINLEAHTFEYRGEKIEPEFSVRDGDEQLVRDEDFEVAYSDNRNAGTVQMTVTGRGFYKDSVQTSFTITPAPLTVRADDQSRMQGEENPELTLTYEGWKGQDDASVFLTPPVVTTEATAESPVGEYDILVSGAEAQNYRITYVAGRLTVTEAVGISSVAPDEAEAQWYTLDGKRLASRPTRPGIYLCGSRKVVVR